MLKVPSRQSMNPDLEDEFPPLGATVVSLVPRKRDEVVVMLYERFPGYDSVGRRVVFRISESLNTKLGIV
jgi:hypothetical protein